MEINEKFQIQTIARIHSPFKEKFGIPRQSGLVPEIKGYIELIPPFNRVEMVAGLVGYSHLWIEFIFHKVPEGKWKASVRPPRLGGNKKVGVLASRSPFRPNRLGLSVVRLEHVDIAGTQIRLYVSGLDVLDNTPVVDIKPYVAYADSQPDALCGYATDAPQMRLQVIFSDQALQQLTGYPEVMQVISSLLSFDPRPAYKTSAESQRIFAMKLYDFDVRWRVTKNIVEVLTLINV